METDKTEAAGENKNRKRWLKRLGIAGFMLFLIKGLVWLGIAFWAWMKLK